LRSDEAYLILKRPLPDSNRGWRICNPLPDCHKDKSRKAFAETPPEPLAQTLAHETQIDPELARVIDAWPKLSDAIKAGIMAMVRATGEHC
jgi:hypothetical protein